MNDTTPDVPIEPPFVPRVTINREPGTVILIGARPPKKTAEPAEK